MTGLAGIQFGTIPDRVTPDASGMRRLWDLELGAGGAGAVTLLSIGLLIASAAVFGSLMVRLHPALAPGGLGTAAAVVLAFFLGLALHEAIHALAFLALGQRPRFGAAIRSLVPYVYVTCPGSRFSRNQYLAVGLAPLVLLDLVGVALMVPAPSAVFGLILVIFNTASASGDLWMASLLIQSPGWIQVEDTQGGFTAWAPPIFAGQAATLRPPIGLNPVGLAWIAGWLIGSLVVLQVVVFGLLVAAGTHPGTRIRLGPMLLAESLPAGRHGVRVQLLPLAIGVAAVGGLLTVAAATVKTRLAGDRPRAVSGKPSAAP